MLNHRLKHYLYKQTWNMWKCKACWDIHRVFDSQCHKWQAEKERIKRITKHKSLYHVVQKQKEFKTATLKTFIKTFINLKLLMNNDLKRKQKHSMNESYLLSIIIISENTILKHLIKKSKLNELKSTSIISFIVNVIYWWKSCKRSKHFANIQENTKQSEIWTLMSQQKKLWIL